MAHVDALDERAVDEHADAVAAWAGSIDVSFNLVSQGDVQGIPLADMTLPDFMRPVITMPLNGGGPPGGRSALRGVRRARARHARAGRL